MTEQQVVYENTLDNNTWLMKVLRTGAYTADLVIIRISDNKEIHREQVGLSYEALFGPDMDDVAHWQNRTVEVVDNYQEGS